MCVFVNLFLLFMGFNVIFEISSIVEACMVNNAVLAGWRCYAITVKQLVLRTLVHILQW